MAAFGFTLAAPLEGVSHWIPEEAPDSLAGIMLAGIGAR